MCVQTPGEGILTHSRPFPSAPAGSLQGDWPRAGLESSGQRGPAVTDTRSFPGIVHCLQPNPLSLTFWTKIS